MFSIILGPIEAQNMIMRLRRSGFLFLTVFLLTSRLNAQPSSHTKRLAGHKIAILVIEPPNNWESRLGAKEGLDVQNGWGGLPRLRFTSAMSLAEQFSQAGADVKMLFMGPAVLWLAMEDVPVKPNPALPSSPSAIKGPHDAVERMRAKGISIHAEEDSSRRFAVHDKVSARSLTFFGAKGAPGVKGPPSVTKLIADGYQVLVF
jgi:hypothetical protein